MAKTQYRVELKLSIRHDSERRVRQAYARLSQWLNEANQRVAVENQKEVSDETSRPLCTGLDPEPGKRSND